jgi:hypothetical protein
MTEPDNKPSTPRETFEHYCEICGEWGSFGYGVNLRHGRVGRWYCLKHRPENVSTMTDGGQTQIE